MHLVKKIMLVLLISFVCLVFLEAVYRYLFPEIQLGNIYQADPVLGHMPIPSYTAASYSREFSYTTTTNSLGLRDREYGVKGNVTRVLVLGDSFVFGVGVDIAQTIPKRLEYYLNSAGNTYEVINAGVSSYGTRQELAYFRDRGYLLEPDMVIMSFYTNDFIDNLEAINHKVNPDGYLISRDADEQQRIIRYAFINMPRPFRIRLFIEQNFRVVNFFIAKLKGVARFFLKRAGSSDIDPAFREQYHRATIRNTLAYLNESARYFEKRNTPFLLVNIPTKEDMAIKTVKKSALEQFAAEQDTLFLDLFSAFANHPVEELYWKYDDHLTSRGNDLMAQAIYETLIKESLVPSSPEQFEVTYANPAR